MKTYRLTIRPLTSFRTPLQSDTIFGHLLWALRYVEGEEALAKFLARCRNDEPPLLVSAGFPRGALPVPVLSPGPEDPEGSEDGGGLSLADRVVSTMLSGALEEDRYLPLPQWRRLAQGMSAGELKRLRRESQVELRQIRGEEMGYPVTRTAVDRITGSAREARLFVSGEVFYGPGREFDIWHKLGDGDEALLERVATWWRWVERNGFGKRKSVGHGVFRIQGDGLVEAGGELPRVENPNGFVTLSAWVPRRGDPTDVTYRTRVKRGKLAEELAIPSPWKKPLLMLEPGTVARLRDGEDVHEWYGGLVESMHWPAEDVPEWQKGVMAKIVQYGYAFPLPVCIEEGA
jgi:CRISPR-associated protein Csm4